MTVTLIPSWGWCEPEPRKFPRWVLPVDVHDEDRKEQENEESPVFTVCRGLHIFHVLEDREERGSRESIETQVTPGNHQASEEEEGHNLMSSVNKHLAPANETHKAWG